MTLLKLWSSSIGIALLSVLCVGCGSSSDEQQTTIVGAWKPISVIYYESGQVPGFSEGQERPQPSDNVSEILPGGMLVHRRVERGKTSLIVIGYKYDPLSRLLMFPVAGTFATGHVRFRAEGAELAVAKDDGELVYARQPRDESRAALAGVWLSPAPEDWKSALVLTSAGDFVAWFDDKQSKGRFTVDQSGQIDVDLLERGSYGAGSLTLDFAEDRITASSDEFVRAELTPQLTRTVVKKFGGSAW